MDKNQFHYHSETIFVCMSCGKVQDGNGQWHLYMDDIREDPKYDIKQSICNSCSKSRFPKFYVEK